MQYFKPDGPYYVGDCMPFFHDGVFHLYYLLDEGHHTALGGLGGHQWAHASTSDLVHWTHHPLAIPISEEKEGSICTGSVFYNGGVYHGYYATRMRDRTQHLSLADSPDGLHFAKMLPNPFASPPDGYNPLHYRDPVVFQDEATGLYHMLVTARLEDYPIPGYGGCLAHLTSPDLRAWTSQAPFLIPGLPGEPECPDYFSWNGWYYLIFSSEGVAHYRMSRHPLGPWIHPPVDTLDGYAARVMKTAAFSNDRRLGAAWLGTRQDDRPDGALQFGGCVFLREIIQHPDGSLGTRFPTEMTPPAGALLPSAALLPLTPGAVTKQGTVHLDARCGLAAALCTDVPGNARFTARVTAEPGAACFGLRLRAEDFNNAFDLQFLPREKIVRLFDGCLSLVEGLDRPFDLEINLQGDVIDVCIDHRRTIINRCPGKPYEKLFFYSQDAQVTFTDARLQAVDFPLTTG